jgi:hypothetical protein
MAVLFGTRVGSVNEVVGFNKAGVIMVISRLPEHHGDLVKSRISAVIRKQMLLLEQQPVTFMHLLQMQAFSYGILVLVMYLLKTSV